MTLCLNSSDYNIRRTNGEGFVFISVSLFVCLSVCLSVGKTRWQIYMKFAEEVGLGTRKNLEHFARADLEAPPPPPPPKKKKKKKKKIQCDFLL